MSQPFIVPKLSQLLPDLQNEQTAAVIGSDTVLEYAIKPSNAWADGDTPAQIVFNQTFTRENQVLDRNVMIQYSLIVEVESGTNNGASGTDLFDHHFADTATVANRAILHRRPLSRVMQTLNVLLNGSSNPITPWETEYPLALYEEQDLNDTGSPSDYDNAGSLIKSRLFHGTGYGNTSHLKHRGSPHLTRGMYLPRVGSYKQVTAKASGVKAKIQVIYDLVEPLPHPFFDNSNPDVIGGLDNLGVELSLFNSGSSGLLGCFMQLATTNATNDTSPSTFKITLDPGSVRLLTRVIRPNVAIPPVFRHKYQDIKIRKSQYGVLGSSITVGPTFSYDFPSITLGVVPDALYLWVRITDQPAHNQMNTMATITGVTMRGTINECLTNSTQPQLYEMSVNNGLQLSYPDWSYYHGGPVCISFLKGDVGGLIAGARMDLQLDITIRFKITSTFDDWGTTNTIGGANGTTQNWTAYIMASTNASMTLDRGSALFSPGLNDQARVAAALQRVKEGGMLPVAGGSMKSSMRKFWRSGIKPALHNANKLLQSDIVESLVQSSGNPRAIATFEAAKHAIDPLDNIVQSGGAVRRVGGGRRKQM